MSNYQPTSDIWRHGFSAGLNIQLRSKVMDEAKPKPENLLLANFYYTIMWDDKYTRVYAPVYIPLIAGSYNYFNIDVAREYIKQRLIEVYPFATVKETEFKQSGKKCTGCICEYNGAGLRIGFPIPNDKNRGQYVMIANVCGDYVYNYEYVNGNRKNGTFLFNLTYYELHGIRLPVLGSRKPYFTLSKATVYNDGRLCDTSNGKTLEIKRYNPLFGKACWKYLPDKDQYFHTNHAYAMLTCQYKEMKGPMRSALRIKPLTLSNGDVITDNIMIGICYLTQSIQESRVVEFIDALTGDSLIAWNINNYYFQPLCEGVGYDVKERFAKDQYKTK